MTSSIGDEIIMAAKNASSASRHIDKSTNIRQISSVISRRSNQAENIISAA